MTPDTTVYMIAGLSVILAGVVIYVISLVLRNFSLKRQLDILKHEDEDRT